MKNTTERAKEIIFISTTQIALPAEINSGGKFMTKRTEKTVLAVFEYCVKAALLASKEGILALEELCLDKGITDTGEILFSRKVDKFLAVMLRLIVDGCYTLDVNQSYLKKLSKYSRKKNRMLLNIVSVFMDGIANGKDIKAIIVDISSYIGVENQRPFWHLFNKLRDQNENDFEYKLTKEQKERIKQINVFFQMKEDECKTLMKQKNEKLSELHSRVPEFKKQSVYVELIYKPEYRNNKVTLYGCSIPETDFYFYKRFGEIQFIGEIPVCYSMYDFWSNFHNCNRDIKKFMTLTEDIPKILKNI